MSQSGVYSSGVKPSVIVETLTGNTGGAVGPTGNNINVVGDGTTVNVTGNPGTSTLTISASGGGIPGVFDTDSGNATPAGGVLNIFGGNNIHTTGAGNTVTVNVAGTTNHALQLGNASGSLTSLGVANNGQIPIGSTGANPVLATIIAGTGISVTNGAGSITIASSGSFAYTNVNSSPYVVLTTDEYLGVDCSSIAITIELPNAPTTGQSWTIKDRTGSSFTHNITVTTVGGIVLIDGATTYTMNTNYSSINVIFDGTNYQVY